MRLIKRLSRQLWAVFVCLENMYILQFEQIHFTIWKEIRGWVVSCEQHLFVCFGESRLPTLKLSQHQASFSSNKSHFNIFQTVKRCNFSCGSLFIIFSHLASFYMQCVYRKRIVFCPNVCKTFPKQPWQEFTPMGPCLIGFLALGVFLGGLWPLKLVTWMFYWKIDLSAISDLKLDHKGNYLNSIT